MKVSIFAIHSYIFPTHCVGKMDRLKKVSTSINQNNCYQIIDIHFNININRELIIHTQNNLKLYIKVICVNINI